MGDFSFMGRARIVETLSATCRAREALCAMSADHIGGDDATAVAVRYAALRAFHDVETMLFDDVAGPPDDGVIDAFVDGLSVLAGNPHAAASLRAYADDDGDPFDGDYIAAHSLDELQARLVEALVELDA